MGEPKANKANIVYNRSFRSNKKKSSFNFTLQESLGRADLIYRLGLYNVLTPLVDQDNAGDHWQGQGLEQEDFGGAKLQHQPVQLFCVSLRCRQGYGSAFRWLSQFLE